ncbi:MAG: sigma-70 family RNA polymerase sigma factor [Lachnospiraceae bacterium]|nr:sigma-70 family RNA polymerase sigma factor [Lachnospiraceae bacterium]
MKPSTEILFEKYRDHIFAAAFSVCRNAADADDVVQDTFLQYHMTAKDFNDEQHIRAWLLRVAINHAKDVIRSPRRRRLVPLEEYADTLCFETPESEELFEQVMALPEKYRVVLHLFYYEDYPVREIAGILRLTESNVKVRLSRGRKLLRESIGRYWEDDEQGKI